jgi:hypothetical protein
VQREEPDRRWILPAEFRGARFRTKVKHAVDKAPKGGRDGESVHLADLDR